MKIAHLTLVLVAAAGGWFAATVFQAGGGIVAPSPSEARTSVGPNQYPMHPWVKSDKPGQCTVCGMALVALPVGGMNPGGPVNGLVLLPVTSVKVIGLQTAEVKRQPLVRTLRVAGMIGEDESRHGVITAPVEGRIDGLGMSCEGDRVPRWRRRDLCRWGANRGPWPLRLCSGTFRRFPDRSGSASGHCPPGGRTRPRRFRTRFGRLREASHRAGVR